MMDTKIDSGSLAGIATEKLLHVPDSIVLFMSNDISDRSDEIRIIPFSIVRSGHILNPYSQFGSWYS